MLAYKSYSTTDRLVIVVTFILLVLFGMMFNPQPDDLVHSWLPAARAILDGQSPYTVDLFVSPPWVAVLFIPLALLPDILASGIMFASILFSLIYIADKMNADKVSIIFLLISPPVIQLLWTGNIDAFVMLGLVVAHPLGIILLSCKPQISLVLIVYSLVDKWIQARRDHLTIHRMFIVLLSPILLLILLSFILFGWWIPEMFDVMTFNTWNWSLFPDLLPLGIALTIIAFRHRDSRYAIASTLFYSPHLTLQSYSVVIMAFIRDRWVTAGMVIGMWIVVILRMI